MKRKKAGSTKHFDLIIFSAVISAFLVFALFFGFLIWVFTSEPSPPSPADEKAFEEEYAAAQKKYEKYLNGPVSGQEVLDLIDNWDETYYMTVEDLEGERFSVNDIDKDDTYFKYWDKNSLYYIDPDAYYKGGFIFGSSTGREKEERWWIGELYFSLVEDSSLSEDNTTENDE
jgi:hypothetical protein